ncbi:Protein of unknown function [Frankineae bacterium MT45]|nr:Protein of unknown function [Frankineae bacterium MT45]
MHPKRRTGVRVAILVVTLAGVTACHHQSSAAGTTTPVTPTSSAVTSSPEESPSESPSESPTAPATTPAAATTSSAATTSNPATPSGPACTGVDVRLAAIPLGSASQQTFVRISLTNKGSVTCTITGYPAVRLRLNGSPVGSAATNSPTPPATVTLAPGATASARLVASTACNAPLSDSLTVILPGDTAAQSAAAQLRACSMTLEPLVRS